MRLKKSILVCLVLAVQMLLPVKSVFAQTSNQNPLNLTTSPLPVSLSAHPGESVSTELKVQNTGTEVEELKVGLMKFSAYGEEGKPQLKDRENGDDYFDWVSFSENSFKVDPGEWHTTKMTIKLPNSAALGYYYAVTFSRLNPPKTTDSNKLVGGTAILVLVESKVANANRRLAIEEFKASRKVYEFLPANFVIKLKNTGNIHLASTGNIFIKQGNKVIATLEVNQAGGNILPSSKRIFTTSWSDGFPVYQVVEKNGKAELKDGKQVYKLRWDSSKIGRLRMGRYTANLLMTYDDGKRDMPLEAVVTFWVIPWRLIFAVIVPLVAVGFLGYSYARLRKRLRKMQEKSNK